MVTGSMAYLYYITHLEQTPITGRERFTIVTNKQLEEISQLEFEKVHHINYCMRFNKF